MIKGIILFFFLFFGDPVYAFESENEWFIRQIAPIFAPIFERCGEGQCLRYGFEDILSWEDKTDNNTVYWSVTVVVLRPDKERDLLAKSFIFRSVSGRQLKIISESSVFVWDR